MERFLTDIKQNWQDRPFIWNEGEEVLGRKIHLPTRGKVLIVGPHPDDPEGVAITCRLLMQSGCSIWFAIVSLSPAGVEDEYARRGPSSDFFSMQGEKSEIRRREQISSAEMFGLTQDRLVFLGMEEDSTLDSWPNRCLLKNHLESMAPDIVIMPMGQDPNRTHSWTYRVFRECAKDLTFQLEKPIVALYNEDPKTVEIRKDLFVFFGEESANWKRALLRTHDSQEQRNIHTRGMGFDERILGMNDSSRRRSAENSSSAKYAEVFEMELFDFPSHQGW